MLRARSPGVRFRRMNPKNPLAFADETENNLSKGANPLTDGWRQVDAKKG